MKKRYYSYQDFEKDVKKILDRVKDTYFKNIYAVPRGGFVLGVRLSHLLSIPMITDKQHISKETLIVDDVVDTGKTLHAYKHYFIACLHWKPKTACFEPKVYCRKTSEYIVYFWEQGSIPLKNERSKKLLEEAK